MQRINATTVELTPEEKLISQVHARLMDQGFSQTRALHMILGGNADLLSDTPELTAVMEDNGFCDWLAL